MVRVWKAREGGAQHAQAEGRESIMFILLRDSGQSVTEIREEPAALAYSSIHIN